MRNRCMKCCSMNNNYSNSNMQNKCKNLGMIEDSCNNICNNTQNYNEHCGCGFDDDNYVDVFPDNPMLAQSYVPTQFLNETFKPCVGLKNGTIFPELVSPYMPGDSMRQNEFIERTNKIGEGCNQCQ